MSGQKEAVLRWGMAWLPFVLSAAAAALLIHFALATLWLAVVLLILVPAGTAFFLYQRAKVREFFTSGAVDDITDALVSLVEEDEDAAHSLPLVRATALGAHGLTDRARSALRYLHSGEETQDLQEHRLVLEILLDSLDGRQQEALIKSETLEQLALPPGPFERGRSAGIRNGVVALARVFAHKTRKGDLNMLAQAARIEPLLHWVMDYGQAIVSARGQDFRAAQRILATAPEWPRGSVFASFNDQFTALIQPASASLTALPAFGSHDAADTR